MYAPAISLAALLGIPAAGFGALALLLQWPRMLYGEANPILGAMAIGSVFVLLLLIVLLRATLASRPATSGLSRDVLDFLALARWHPAVKVAFFGLLALTTKWSLRGANSLFLFGMLGWKALASGDVRDDLDRIGISYQLALGGGMPLLFLLHLLSRWQPNRQALVWLLVPVIFVGTALAVIIIGTIFHS